MVEASEKQLSLSVILEAIGKKEGVPLTSELPCPFKAHLSPACPSLPPKYGMEEISDKSLIKAADTACPRDLYSAIEIRLLLGWRLIGSASVNA